MLISFFCPILTLNTNELLAEVRDTILTDKYTGRQKFVAIFDAGSTGTRISIFGFLQPGNILDFFEIVKEYPGLQDLSETGIQDQIRTLITKGDEILHSYGFKLSGIPVAFQATAGLRLLNDDKKKKIIDTVKFALHSNNIYFKEAKVLSGMSEGLYALESLNFLKKFNFNVLKTYGCQNPHLRNLLIRHSPGFCDDQKTPILDSEASKVNPSGFSFRYKTKNEYFEDESVLREKYESSNLVGYENNYQMIYSGIIDMGGASLQLAYEFSLSSDFNDQLRVIQGRDRNIFIQAFDGWGLNEAMKVFKRVKMYRIKGKSFFDMLLKDFKDLKKPEINLVDELYLISYFYDKLTELGCEYKTSLGKIESLFKDKCRNRSEFCEEIYYMKRFLQSLGIEENKELRLVHDIGGINLNWSLAKGLMLLDR